MKGNLSLARPDPADVALSVKFYNKGFEHPEASEQAGRPVSKYKVYVLIPFPGTHDEFDGPATDDHKRRFPDAWAAFQRNESHTIIGTPLEKYPELNDKQIMELRTKGLYTIEQLAAASDLTMQSMGPDARKIVKKARDFMERNRYTDLEADSVLEVADENTEASAATLEAAASVTKSERKSRGSTNEQTSIN